MKLKELLKVLKKVFFGVLIILIVGFTALITLIYKQGNINQLEKANVIVVLGASQWQGQPSPMLQARLDKALNLFQSGYAQYLILTGGIGEGDKISESQVGKNYLINRGVDKGVIFIEEKSRTTLQSLHEVKQIVRNQSFKSVILVSHDFHIFRAKKMLEDLGILAYTASVETKNNYSEFKFLVREAAIYLLYSLFKV